LKNIIFWGTYDKGKPRVRLLIDGLKLQGVNVIECHIDIWSGVEDKSQLKGIKAKIKKIISLLIAYPKLICRYFKLPEHKIVVISYMGQFDILIFWLINRIKKKKIIWDLFISLYDTVVCDRQLASPKSLLGRFLFYLEWLGVRAANTVFMDTKTHAEYIENLYGLDKDIVKRVFVGAESDKFKQIQLVDKNEIFTVLFYGQFIPLHGIETIISAAKIFENNTEDCQWVIIGKGQEKEKIDKFIDTLKIKSIKRILWVSYEDLIYHIAEANVCLGIFNKKGKANRVIPNKVYQILSGGKPLITADTPAIREVLKETELIKLVNPGDSEDLASAILKVKNYLEIHKNASRPIIIDADIVGKQFIRLISIN